MRKTTLVFIKIKDNHREKEFTEWCAEHISYYSTESTWTVYKPGSFLVFKFGEATDATAFKLTFSI